MSQQELKGLNYCLPVETRSGRKRKMSSSEEVIRELKDQLASVKQMLAAKEREVETLVCEATEAKPRCQWFKKKLLRWQLKPVT